MGDQPPGANVGFRARFDIRLGFWGSERILVYGHAPTIIAARKTTKTKERKGNNFLQCRTSYVLR